MYYTILSYLFLILYKYYLFIWNFIFRYVDNITFVYKINDKNLKNITLQYYLGNNLDEGSYYVRRYDINGTSHIAFNGQLTDIYHLNISPSDNMLRRKKIILLNNYQPIIKDLSILDNYKSNMLKVSNCISDMELILKCLNINCTHISIINLVPFNKIIKLIEHTTINELYF